MVKLGWFVCPTVSMVTTSHATGLKKTLSKISTKYAGLGIPIDLCIALQT